jgi:hypothetical protein
MDRPHTTDGQATNPDVRFERSDIDDGAIAKFGVALVLLLLGSAAVVTVLFVAFNRQEDRRKLTDLPPAAVDEEAGGALPPEPRLEVLDDIPLKRRDIPLQPPRSMQLLETREAQESLLANGDPEKGILPIAEAIDRLAGKLPQRKAAAQEVALPGKAASGRVVTGGQ